MNIDFTYKSDKRIIEPGIDFYFGKADNGGQNVVGKLLEEMRERSMSESKKMKTSSSSS